MKNTALEKLFFSVELIDKVTNPAKGVSKCMKDVAKTGRDGFMGLTRGALAVGGTIAVLTSFTASARNFNKALNEVSALGVVGEEIVKLGDAALDFSAKFGGSADDVVKAGYDIQSSIAGLNNGELAKFTYNSAVLAKATKADASTITGYVSTMAGVFEKQMNMIGKAQWMEQLTGKTAKAVQMFRTTGTEMQAAFAQLGASGASQGIGMDEQIAVMGMLQQVTGSGSVAATQYRSFLDGAVAAQKKLKLSFVDVQGKMLPMAAILEKIKGKYGSTIEAAEALELKQAFGSTEAVKAITTMLDKSSSLKNNIAELGKVKGMDVALQMAEIQVDPLEKFYAAIQTISIALGKTLLPALNLSLGVASFFLGMFQTALKWFPPLRWGIAGVILAVGALSLAIGTLAATAGLNTLYTANIMMLKGIWGWLIKNTAATQSMTRVEKAHAMLSTGWLKIKEKTIAVLKFLRLNLLWNKAALLASAVWTKVLAVANWFMNSSFIAATAAVWAFTAALLANPVTWVVLGIMALIGAIYLCVKYWDVLKAAFSTVVDFMAKHWQWLLAGMLGPVGIAVKLIIDYWDYIVEAVFWCFEKIKGFWTGLWDFGKAIVQGLFSWIIGKIEGILGFLTKIPFIGDKIQAGLDKVKEFAGVDVHQTKIEQPVVSAVTSARTKDVKAGGVRNTSHNRTTNYGGVTINTSSPVGPGQMEDMWVLQA